MEQTWATGTVYKVDDVVVIYEQEFVCIKEHTSKVFANELFNDGCWKRK